MACTTVDCLPPITGREKLGRAPLLIPLGNTFGFRQLGEQRLEKCGLCDRKNTRGRGLWGKTQVSARVRSTSGEPRVVPHNLSPEKFFLSCSMASSLQPISGREKVGSRTQEVQERNSEG